MRDRSIPQNNYLEDNDGRKLHTDKEKCVMMKDTGKNIVRMTEEEELKFDREHSEYIEAFINNNIHRIQHHEKIDLSRLDEHNHFTKPIKEHEVVMAIKRLKNKAPGHSTINKRILEKLPKKAVIALTNIYNACLSCGYFPSSFKTQLLISYQKKINHQKIH